MTKRIGTVETLGPTSFSTGVGQATVVQGPNGSGKTTLLRILLGKENATSGSVRLAPSATSTSPGIASVTGPVPCYRDLTIGEHLQMIQASWGGESSIGSFHPLVECFELQRVLPQFAVELSSGERQLTALIFALYRPAALLVLDEPEQRLDLRRRIALADVLEQRLNQGAAIVMATHDDSLAQRLSTEVVHLGSSARALP